MSKLLLTLVSLTALLWASDATPPKISDRAKAAYLKALMRYADAHTARANAETQLKSATDALTAAQAEIQTAGSAIVTECTGGKPDSGWQVDTKALEGGTLECIATPTPTKPQTPTPAAPSTPKDSPSGKK